jgi:hypothetical protein
MEPTNRTNRAPFTKPLTGRERRYIQVRIDQKLRADRRHYRGGMSNLDFEAEVETALAEYRKEFPPVLKVPTVALSALING